MAADPGEVVVRAEHHRCGVPADEPADPELHRFVAREERLLLRRDGVDVPRLSERRDPDVEHPGALEELVEDEPGSLGTARTDEGVERIHPLLRLRRVDVGKLVFELVEDVVDRVVLHVPLRAMVRRASCETRRRWTTIRPAAGRAAAVAVAVAPSAGDPRALRPSRSRRSPRVGWRGASVRRDGAERLRRPARPTSYGPGRRA